MNDSQRRAFGAYLREAADVLGLVDWKLLLVRDRPPAAPGAAAGHCTVTYGHAHAQLWFEPSLPDERPDWIRYVTFHELLHIPLDAPFRAWRDPIEDLVGAPVLDAVATGAVTSWEHCIDQLGRHLAPLVLPLCNWDAEPDPNWIGAPDSDGDLVLYSRMYAAAGRSRPLS